MERKQIANVVVPAVAVAALIALAALVIVSGGGGPEDPKKGGGGTAANRTAADQTTAGISDKLPPLDGVDWKDIGGGLRILDVKEGEGEAIPAGAQVIMHYTGWLKDGTEFDSSVKKNQPLDYPLGQLVAGWQKGIPGMKPGGIRRLFVPSDLGYGPQQKEKIPPNSDLVFEVKLLSWSPGDGGGPRR